MNLRNQLEKAEAERDVLKELVAQALVLWQTEDFTVEAFDWIAAARTALAPQPCSFCGAAHSDGACNTKAPTPTSPKEGE